MTNFTPEQLILHHYNELPPAESLQVQEALDESWTLQEKYRVIKEAATTLDKALKQPRSATIDTILRYGNSIFSTANLEN